MTTAQLYLIMDNIDFISRLRKGHAETERNKLNAINKLKGKHGR